MKKDYKEYIVGKKHLAISGLTIITTLLSILICTSIGFYLDKTFSTKPYLTIIGLIVSYPVTQIVLSVIIKKHISN